MDEANCIFSESTPKELENIQQEYFKKKQEILTKLDGMQEYYNTIYSNSVVKSNDAFKNAIADLLLTEILK